MKERIDYQKASPEALKGMLELEKYLTNSGLERPLYELVKLRASQINGWNRLAISLRAVPGSYRTREFSVSNRYLVFNKT